MVDPVDQEVELNLVQLVQVILLQQLHLKEILGVLCVVVDLMLMLLKVVLEVVVLVVLVQVLVVVELVVLVRQVR